MKFRKSFVTNSSSSSYICEICGNDVSGMDLSLSEAEMVECKNGHRFCENHIDSPIFNKILSLYDNEDSPEWNEEWRYELATEYCPICNFNEYIDSELLQYIAKSRGISLAGIKQELKENFFSYDEFKKYIQNK